MARPSPTDHVLPWHGLPARVVERLNAIEYRRLVCRLSLLSFALIGIAALAGAASLHPFHVSVAEIERNAETNRVEFALRLWPEDLERALSARAGKAVDLENTENIDELILAYIDRTFFIAPPGEKPSAAWKPKTILDTPDENGEQAELPRLTWVGKEVGGRDVWVYFEMRLPESMPSLEGAWISNSLLVRTIDGHENMMQIRDGDLRVTLRTDEQTRWVRIATEPKAEPTGE